MRTERSAERQVLEVNQPIFQISGAEGVDRWNWRRNVPFLAIGIPLTAFSVLSSTYGVSEISKLILENIQLVNVIPPLTEIQINDFSQLAASLGTVTGFIGGFALTKMIIVDAPRIFRGQ